MNHEFVTAKMAPIPQHFFQLFQGDYPGNKDGRDAMVTAMNKTVSYEYQDTDPENGTYGTQGGEFALARGIKKHPELRDPIGLKGVFTSKTRLLRAIINCVSSYFTSSLPTSSNLKTKKSAAYNVVGILMPFN